MLRSVEARRGARPLRPTSNVQRPTRNRLLPTAYYRLVVRYTASFVVLSLRPVTPALLPLTAAAVAFLAAQGFGRFGFGLVLPAMRDALQLSDGTMGLLAGIGLTAYLVASAPAGALTTRFGTRRVVV